MPNFDASLKPYADPPASPIVARARLAQRIGQVEPPHPGQLGGTRWAIGCVSLEVTQRCNLDCSACYLSEEAESIEDIPLEFLLDRIRVIHQHYGAGCDVQISGGDPTLRPKADLIRIVQEIARLGMRSSLFTNGIKASRALLRELAAAGLNDVAFHVDVTQERRQGGQLLATEAALNPLREEYIARAQGLGINIYFNTTVVEGNFAEMPMLVDFFAHHTEHVSFASFQMQADTGRGVLRDRPNVISQESMMRHIQQGLGAPLDFDALMPGHSKCNRYATALLIDGRAYDAFAPKRVVQAFFRHSTPMRLDRQSWRGALRSVVIGLLRAPAAIPAAGSWLAQSSWTLRRHWWHMATRQKKLRKLSFLIHNFMDASALDTERTHACVFMTMTPDGPISMCAYNAQREHYLHRPLQRANGEWFEPLPKSVATGVTPVKFLKGRQRQEFLLQRKLTRTTAHVHADQADHAAHQVTQITS